MEIISSSKSGNLIRYVLEVAGLREAPVNTVVSYRMSGIFFGQTYIYQSHENYPYPFQDARHQTMNIGINQRHIQTVRLFRFAVEVSIQ